MIGISDKQSRIEWSNRLGTLILRSSISRALKALNERIRLDMAEYLVLETAIAWAEYIL